MAAQPDPKVKKTKKSSYKPLSQLNEDRLTELNRVEKPETTSRVFHYGLAHKARLRHNVNVWFRDHRHSIAVLQRQQRAVQHQMGRLQHDVRRVRRDEYKRRQEEIRTKLTRLQLRLLQWRVVERFQKNAMTKMAARGEQSLVELRMMGQKSDHVTGHQHTPSASTSAAALPHSSANTADDINKMQAHPDRRKSEPSFSTRKENGNSGGTACASNTDLRSKSGSQKPENPKQKSMRRFSESDVGKEEGVDTSPHHSQMAAWEDSLNPLTASINNLDIIPEDAPAPKESGDDLQGKFASLKNLKSSASAASQESRVNSRVLEVRKHRPHSPKTHKISRPRRATLGTLPHTTKLKTLSPITPNASQASRTDQERDDPGLSSGSALTEPHPPPQNLEQDFSETDSNSQSSSEAVDENSEQHGEKDAQKTDSTPKHSQESEAQGTFSEMDRVKEKNTATDTENKRETNTESKGENVAGTEPHPEQEVFSFVPSRAQVIEDVGMMLGEEDEEGQGHLWKGGRQGAKGLPSLAARVRQQRKREAKRRSQLLDREPLVQYYRSVRGTLEPLLSEPCRKSFPFPSGRPQYEQHKLLREELQKDVDRQHNINTFFNDLFQRQTEAVKPAAQEAGNTGKAASKAGPMNLLLQMRQKGKTTRRTSIQQLAACQYLRLHDWEAKSKTGKSQDDVPVERSWATAENRLKAGFLAMDFTGQH